MDERLQFVARRLAGEPMAELCREFGIARKTGYKIFDRYQECGIQGLTDRSRRPHHYAHKWPFQVENYILNVKREHTTWGARKIRERLIRRFSGVRIPANSTIHALLDRHGFVERRGRARRHAQGTPLSLGQRPNELWCTDCLLQGRCYIGLDVHKRSISFCVKDGSNLKSAHSTHRDTSSAPNRKPWAQGGTVFSVPRKTLHFRSGAKTRMGPVGT